MASKVHMPEGWTSSTVEQLMLDGVVTYGVVQPGQAVESGTPMLRVNNFRGYGLDVSDVMRIANDVEAKYSRTRIRADDVLLTVVGSVGQVAVVPKELTGWNLARAVALLRPRERELARWIASCLRAPTAQHALGVAANTTVQTTINLKDLRKLELPMPPPAERAAIQDLLSALDDRIDLLRQTNATLEAIAQALFKSWFIDFGPVRAKAEGCEPEGMNAATAALFPAEFEESALGLIPKGWKAGSVYEIASVIYGAPFASKLFNADGNGRPLVRIRDLRVEAPGVWTPEVHPKGYLIRPGDIVVGMDGEFRAYLWGGQSAWLNQRVCCFQPIAPHGAAFVRCSIAAPLAHIEATEVATTVIHLGKGDIDRFKVVVPTPAVAKAFSELTAPLYARIVGNKAQGRNLAAARDTLLPRLISGKLRLPEAQEQLEGAVV
jgi:type I restriction enzyme S subunit